MKAKNILLFFTAFCVGVLIYVGQIQYQKFVYKNPASIDTSLNDATYQKIVFAGGCFWCTEAEFDHAPGVVSAISGYIGGGGSTSDLRRS